MSERHRPLSPEQAIAQQHYTDAVASARQARRGTIEAQLAAAKGGRDAAADNLHLAELRYRGGIGSYFQDLTARQALYSAERSLVANRRVRAANLLVVYRVFGGDALEDQTDGLVRGK